MLDSGAGIVHVPRPRDARLRDAFPLTATPMNDTVLLDRDGAVATLTLNRPDALNTLDFAMIDALVARTAEVAADDALRVVVMRGAGKHFMAGGDIRTFAARARRTPPAERKRLPADDRARCTRRSSTCTGCRIRSSAACTAPSPASGCR